MKLARDILQQGKSFSLEDEASNAQVNDCIA